MPAARTYSTIPQRPSVIACRHALASPCQPRGAVDEQPSDECVKNSTAAAGLRPLRMPVLSALASFRRRPSSLRSAADDISAAPGGGPDAAPWLPEQTCTVADESNVCEICLENYAVGERLKRLPCLHAFHSTCINSWLRQATTCPQCRMDVYETDSVSPDGGLGSRSALALIDPMIFDDEDFDPARRLQALTEAEQDDAFLWQAYLSDHAAQTHLASQLHVQPTSGYMDEDTVWQPSPQHMRRRNLWERLRRSVSQLGAVSSRSTSRSTSTPQLEAPSTPGRRGDPFPSPAGASASSAGRASPRRSQSLGSSSARRRRPERYAEERAPSGSAVTVFRMGRWQVELQSRSWR